MDLRNPSLDIICIHINELSHMGRLDNEVSHNAVKFYHCFKMWASQEKKDLLACITLNLIKLFIISHSFLEAPP